MITNRDIHSIADKGYSDRRGKSHRTGFIVRWERRTAEGSPMFCVYQGVASTTDVESDCAGHLDKTFAIALAKRLVADGYTGVYIQKVDDKNGTDIGNAIRFSADYDAVPAALAGVHIETVDGLGREFDRFFARRDSIRPGWFVWGRNPGYGDNLVKLVAYPDKPARVWPGRNCAMHAGFRTKRATQAVADALNG